MRLDQRTEKNMHVENEYTRKISQRRNASKLLSTSPNQNLILAVDVTESSYFVTIPIHIRTDGVTYSNIHEYCHSSQIKRELEKKNALRPRLSLIYREDRVVAEINAAPFRWEIAASAGTSAKHIN